MPVYNEASSFPTAFDRLLAKKLEGLEVEIVVVESNSSDGTRDEVMKYRGRAGVKIILEPSPRGKGHAVRAGLKVITGDVVIIQDADLEYDLEDYEALLEPCCESCRIRAGRASWRKHVENAAVRRSAAYRSCFEPGTLVFHDPD